MKIIIYISVISALFICGPSFAQDSNACSNDSYIALINGKIYLMDENDSTISSILIQNNKVVALEPNIKEYKNCIQIIDLNNRVVIPGLIDNHIHYIRIANRPGYDLRALEVTFNINDALSVIEAKTKKVPKGKMITTIGGIRRTQWAEKRFPSLSELDAISPDHPVYLSERGAGPGQTNSLAKNMLQELGIDVKEDGSISNGSETAKAYDVLASSLTNEDRKRQMKDVSNYALSVGLTTVMDMSGTVPGVGFIDQTNGYDFFLEMVRNNNHKLRTRIFFPGLDQDEELVQLSGYLDNKWPNYGPDMAKIIGIGEWSVGRNLFNQQPLGEIAIDAQRKIAERGWPYHQHLHSIEEISAHLDVWEDLNKKYNLSEMRWTPGHLSGITPELINRIKKLNLGIGLHSQPYHSGSSNGGPPWKTALESDLVAIGAGTDGARINSLNPWATIYYMVTGINISGVKTNANETISRYEAVKLFSSSDQGWFTKEDGILGGINVGGFADLVVLEKDFFNEDVINNNQIRSMKSVLTIVNGEIVFSSGEIIL